MVNLDFDIIRSQIMADPVNRTKLTEALRRAMMTDDYISMIDSIRLRNWICQLYELL